MAHASEPRLHTHRVPPLTHTASSGPASSCVGSLACPLLQPGECSKSRGLRPSPPPSPTSAFFLFPGSQSVTIATLPPGPGSLLASVSSSLLLYLPAHVPSVAMSPCFMLTRSLSATLSSHSSPRNSVTHGSAHSSRCLSGSHCIQRKQDPSGWPAGCVPSPAYTPLVCVPLRGMHSPQILTGLRPPLTTHPPRVPFPSLSYHTLEDFLYRTFQNDKCLFNKIVVRYTQHEFYHFRYIKVFISVTAHSKCRVGSPGWLSP